MKMVILNQACLDKDVLFSVFSPIKTQKGWIPTALENFDFSLVSKGINKEEILSMIPLTILIDSESPLIYLRQIFYNSTILNDFQMLWRVSLPELKEVKKRVGNNKKYLQSIIDAETEKNGSKFILDLRNKINLLDEFILALVEVCTEPESKIVNYINQDF
jgi:hypothetical protein